VNQESFLRDLGRTLAADWLRRTAKAPGKSANVLVREVTRSLEGGELIVRYRSSRTMTEALLKQRRQS